MKKNTVKILYISVLAQKVSKSILGLPVETENL